MPFDWDTIPRGSVGGLGAWRGFRGLSGDLVRRVIQELHPYAQVEFRAESDSLLGPPTRKNNHGYLASRALSCCVPCVGLSRFALSLLLSRQPAPVLKKAGFIVRCHPPLRRTVVR